MAHVNCGPGVGRLHSEIVLATLDCQDVPHFRGPLWIFLLRHVSHPFADLGPRLENTSQLARAQLLYLSRRP